MTANWKSIPIQRWSELPPFIASLGHDFVYRGQSNSQWPLQTSLERSCDSARRVAAERSLLAAFKSRAHHYAISLPSEDDNLEWLALMQHYGAPTRLLDWTRSPYVAAYFGAENALKENKHFSIWAIDVATLKRAALQNINQISRRFVIDPFLLGHDTRFGDPQSFTAYLLSNDYTLVAPVQARRMNERLTTQQGLFLCMGSLARTFQENLMAVTGKTGEHTVIRIDLPIETREEVLDALDAMNINRATLFPGLDGFAQYLRTRISIEPKREAKALRELGFL